MTQLASKKMKWHGWGLTEKSFDASSRPHFIPFLEKEIKQSLTDETVVTPVAFDTICLPDIGEARALYDLLVETFDHTRVSITDEDRLLHTYGKSFRDLWRIRRGIISHAPDIIFYPKSKHDVQVIFEITRKQKVIIIPFGGGSNIVGAIESQEKHNNHIIICVDMSQMNNVIEIDSYSQMVHVQAGVFGPDLEAALNQRNMTLGHFPDSFEFSTVGGWIATRSAGMLSDKYGKIEDMVISLEVVTPTGEITTRNVPKNSNGININHVIIGSEGCLGIITSATLRISKLDKKIFVGYLFPTFEKGIRAMQACAVDGVMPAMSRLSDPAKTQLSAAFKKPGSRIKSFVESSFKWYLRRIKRFDLMRSCIMLNCYEGRTDKAILLNRKEVEKIYSKYGAASLGQSPGKSFNESKYDFPYLRDFVMDYGLIADVSETATTWKNIRPLYEASLDAFETAAEKFDQPTFIGCHISHTYQSGASLYFTFASKESSNPLEQYDALKSSLEQTFLDQGATLSHHHAVGYEHRQWLEEEIGQSAIKIFHDLKKSIDPDNLMNPDKLI